jgi:hypothetical protein
MVKRYSDALLITLLKAYRPERFKDHTAVEYSGDVKHRVEAYHEHKGALPDVDQLAAILKILADAGALDPGAAGPGALPAPDVIHPVMRSRVAGAQ